MTQPGTSGLRPAVYYPYIYLKGGAERVISQLIRRSRHEWTVYTNHFDPNQTFPELAEARVVRLHEIPVQRTLPAVAGAILTLLTQRLDLSNHGSLLVVSEGLGNLVALRSSVPTSCICLTPFKAAYDQHNSERMYRRGVRPHYRLAIAAYKQLDRFAWRRYQRVFCNSDEVRRRLLVNRLVDPRRVEVAHHGVDLEFYRPNSRREPFFLVGGRIMWVKNVQLAIRSFMAFKPDPFAGPFRLVVAGMVDNKSRPYLERLRLIAGNRPDVEFVESPSDAEMLDLYQRCHAVIFPSRNEDWGLVPLEAMACGKPVLATDRGGPRESVVDGLTGFLREDRTELFTEAMVQLSTMNQEELERLAQRARERACQFTWHDFVARIDAHIDELTATAQSQQRPSLAVGE
jgi:glycosyltransferase involved in cell wall biosynthesis